MQARVCQEEEGGREGHGARAASARSRGVCVCIRFVLLRLRHLRQEKQL